MMPTQINLLLLSCSMRVHCLLVDLHTLHSALGWNFVFFEVHGPCK
jgi:hypothetical protein